MTEEKKFVPGVGEKQAALSAAQSRAKRISRSKTVEPKQRETPIAFSYLRVSTKEQARRVAELRGIPSPLSGMHA